MRKSLKQNDILPFYANTKDNLHCVQAALRAVLKTSFPHKTYTYAYLDRVTNHEPGNGTWDSAMLLFLARSKFEVIYIAKFDYKRFARFGDAYLQSFWTDEIYQAQKKFSNFATEQKNAQKLIQNKSITVIHRSANIRDIKSLWRKKYFLMIPVNANVLDRITGYASHMVLVTKITDTTIYFHDPGLPPIPNRRASIKRFMQAASYPDGKSADIIAIRKMNIWKNFR